MAEQVYRDVSCLHRVVGVKDYASHPSEVGVYINDLAGITSPRASATADHEYQQGNEMLSDRIKFACGLVADDLGPMLAPIYQMKADLETKMFGVERSTKTVTVAGIETRGMRISVNRRDRIAGIRINRLSLAFGVAGPVTVTITDGIATKTVDCTDSWEMVDVNFFTTADSVDITYQTVGGESYGNSSISQRYCNCSKVKGKYLAATGLKNGSQVGDYAFGLSVEASYACDESRVMCAIRHRLTYLILYKAASLVCGEMASTERMNPVSYLDRGQANDLAKAYSEEYDARKKAFAESMRGVIEGISSLCITCKGNRYAYQLP